MSAKSHMPHAAESERAHFDALVQETGEIWWGSTTPAAKLRLDRRVQMFFRAMERFSDPLVLEIGCGTGAFTGPVLEARPDLRIDAFDVSPKAVEAAQQRFGKYPHARFYVGTAEAVDVPDNTYDAVMGVSVLHHIPLEVCLRESFRVLKPGGLFWFSEPNFLNPQIFLERKLGPMRRWLQVSPDETAFVRWTLAAQLRAAGFRTVNIQPFDFLHPGTPRSVMRAVDAISRAVEHVPLVREISGSLHVVAYK